MTAETAVAVYDDAALERLAALANPTDIASQSGPDTLKINYDEDSIHPRGVWVLGQKKKDNVITEHGSWVTKIIILTTRYRHSYYHEPTGEAIGTQLFEVGSQPPDKAEVDAKVAALGGALKFQTVLIGMALTEGGLKEFVSYQGGVAYAPLRDHLLAVSTIITPTRVIKGMPLFSHVTILGESKKDKKGTITFYIPSFEKGPQLTAEQIEFFAGKRAEAYAYIDFTNGRAAERKAATVAPVYASPATDLYTPPPAARPVDMGSMKSITPAPMEVDIPLSPGTSTSSTDEYDIEAAMAAIIGK